MLEHEAHGDGRSIVFVHGLTLDRALLREASEPVFAGRTGWRRLYLDLPGHGGAPVGDTLPSADGLLEALHRFVAEVAGPSPLLVGHAYGAYLVQGLVSVGPAPGGIFLACPVVEPDLLARRLPPQRIAVRAADLDFASDAERVLFEGEVAVQTPALLDAFRRVVAPAHAAADREFIAEVRKRYALSVLARSAALRFPGVTALACGRDDYWAGFVDAANLAMIYPRAALTVVPDCGTMLPLEVGDRYRALLSDWLDRVEAAPPPLPADVDVARAGLG
jgi:pimeloyl-ACP methyl ester carboxylesterase